MNPSPNSLRAGSPRLTSVPIGRAAGRGYGSGRSVSDRYGSSADDATRPQRASLRSGRGGFAEEGAPARRAGAPTGTGGVRLGVAGGAPGSSARGYRREAELGTNGVASRGEERRDGFAGRARGRSGAPEADARPTAGDRSVAGRRQAAVSAAKEAGSTAIGALSLAGAWAVAHRALAVCMASLLVVAIALYAPLQAYYAAVRTNEALSNQLSSINASNETMQAQVDALMTREGIEDEARRRGYVQEGETAVEMSGVTDSMDPSSDPTVTSSDDSGDSGSSDGSGSSSSDTSSTSGDDATVSSANGASVSDAWYTGLLDFVFAYDPSTQGVS